MQCSFLWLGAAGVRPRGARRERVSAFKYERPVVSLSKGPSSAFGIQSDTPVKIPDVVFPMAAVYCNETDVAQLRSARISRNPGLPVFWFHTRQPVSAAPITGYLRRSGTIPQ